VRFDQRTIRRTAYTIGLSTFITALVGLQDAIAASLALLARDGAAPAILDLARAATAIPACVVAIVTAFACLSNPVAAPITSSARIAAAPAAFELTQF
jgi:hypothetical protein